MRVARLLRPDHTHITRTATVDNAADRLVSLSISSTAMTCGVARDRSALHTRRPARPALRKVTLMRRHQGNARYVSIRGPCLEPDVVAGLIDHLTRFPQLLKGAGDEALPAEARVDGHQEHDVDLIQHVLSVVQGGGGVKHKTCTAVQEIDRIAAATAGKKSAMVKGSMRAIAKNWRLCGRTG